MRVRDLLDDEVMGVELRTDVDDARLERRISGCAQSELMDPTPFLLQGELVLTTGMGLHFEDRRTWDAYVERLASVGISALAFGVGRIHPEIPEGLRAACAEHAVPLFELPEDLPLLQFSRHIWQELAAQRYEIVRRGWELADECTRLATRGVPILEVLERVAEAIGAHVTLLDPGSVPLATAGDAPARTDGITTLPLPGGPGARFLLRIRGGGDGQLLQPLLGPVAAVLAMQLSYTLASTSPLHDPSAAHLVEALRGEREAGDELEALASAAGFDATEPWHVVVLAGPDSMPNAGLRLSAWRLQVMLEAHFRTVRFVERAHLTTFLLQGPVSGFDAAHALADVVDVKALAAQHAADVRLDELALTLRIAGGQTFAPGVRRLPALDLAAIAHALPGAGLVSLAGRLVAPLTEADPTGTLMLTLRSYLELSGASRDVSAALFIHRNTLSYRVRRIEELLDVDLADGETRSTLLLALRILA